MRSGGCTELSMSGLPIDDPGSSSSATDPMSLEDFFDSHSEDEEETPQGLWPTAVKQDGASSGRGTTTTGVMHPGTTLTDAMRDFLVATQGDLDPDSRLLRTTKRDGATTDDQAVLSPLFVEALMGYPPEWTVCELSATPSSPTSSLELGEIS
jgi:hypothetical protein